MKSPVRVILTFVGTDTCALVEGRATRTITVPSVIVDESLMERVTLSGMSGESLSFTVTEAEEGEPTL
ncbi:MAG: hypothetical protein F4158_02935 [Synechococcus sp. SB0675_bin_7]|nr:hypothetical protein [Synechococcus sp. SB0675_bin_7]